MMHVLYSYNYVSQFVFCSHCFFPWSHSLLHHLNPVSSPSTRLCLTTCHLAFSCGSSSVFTCLAPPRCLHMLNTHLLQFYLFLESVSYSFALVSTLPPCVRPRRGGMNWCVSRVDRPSSRCLPTATLFPSCVAVFLCPVPLCLCLSLSPPLRSLPSFTLSRPLVSVSLIASVPRLLSPFLLFPPRDRPVRKIQPHVREQSDAVLSACMHAILSAHLHLCAFWCGKKKSESVRLCSKQTNRPGMIVTRPCFFFCCFF